MPSATAQHKLKISIIGAGPASLALGCVLQKHGVAFTLFEASPELRTQGGSLDLHPQSGQRALKAAGLWGEFKKHARPECDVMKIVDMSGEILWDENGADKQASKGGEAAFDARPEIDRLALATLMFDNLDAGSVRFGKKVTEVVPSAQHGNKYDVHFADGTQELACDVVVGGDGAWSKVRKALSDQVPEYSGISSVWGTCANVRGDAWLLQYAGEGSLMAFGEGCAVQSQRQGDGSLRTYASLRVPEDFLETCGIDWTDAHTARKQYVERYFSHVHEGLRRLVLSCADGLERRSFYELPVGFRWPHRQGVTLIGDAAHVFTPFAGEGVNVAMEDALVLAQEIVKVCNGEKSLDEGLVDYEEEMFPRSARAAVKTAKGKEGHFSGSGSREFADRLKAHYSHGQGKQQPGQ
ncbi:hypothetical protein ACJQWK_06146 [Exserohilum turcicum]|uniref:FAD-binding domain-containing protein n=1 Tax=Exserohilum turcicum (strain 28A) TaxID=671987 RepID=R0IWR8_EXST2|nr:uncharacterized protein SETTUDRAFT_168232 [Exserohilum turcica Et28A]EOA89036.1 hypothetical protein SETTUDRAFT_168232 [Exserohilum turcica Et28A]